MRIAFVSDEVSGFHNGGIGTYVVEAGHALTSAGHEVWLITEPPTEEVREAMRRIDGFSQVRFVDECAAAKSLPYILRAPSATRFAKLAYATLVAAEQEFDYIEFADYGAAGSVTVAEQRWFRSLGRAVVGIALHSPTFDCIQYNQALHHCSLYQRELIALEHETLRVAPYLWSPSSRLREIVANRLNLDAARIPLIRYPMRHPSPPPPVRSFTALEDLRFAFFGRIEPRKGVRQIVEAWASMPNLSIECIGRDGPTSPLQTSEVAYLRKRGIGNVTFAGNLTRAAAIERIRSADVIVLPSPWDNWPNACLEAMAAGRIVIGGKNGGMGEMIEHGVNGFLVDGSDPADLHRVIVEDLREALPRLTQISERAALRAREISRPADYVRSIEQFVAQRSRGSAEPKQPNAALVSIVIPYYGESADFLHAAVSSAACQTHPHIEILVVDDGSVGPHVESTLQEAQRIDARVQVHRKPNGGLASARNHGIERAKGDFLLMLDADNRLRHDYAATALHVLSQEPDAVAAIPDMQSFADQDDHAGFLYNPLAYDPALWLCRNSLGDAGAMLRGTLFSTHKLRYDSNIDCYADWALWLDVARLGLRTVRIPRVLYDYRIRSDSMSAASVWDQHLPMLGYLVEHHAPFHIDAPTKDLLHTLSQGWGIGALITTVRSDLATADRQLATVRRAITDPVAYTQPAITMRHAVANALGNIADRWPRIGSLARHAIRNLLRVHGIWKDRRS
jgi:glycosyltransferase involved in cell wall biosynthesis